MRDELIHIALASDRRYLPGLQATVVSMIRSTAEPQRLRFHVFSDGLTDEDRASVVNQTRAFGYDEAIDFRVPNMERVKARFSAFRGETHSPYLRLFFPELLPEFDWVLWTDVDVLWFRDPAKLWAERDSGKSLVWSQDIRSTRLASQKAAKWENMRNVDDYACSGVVLMNLKRLRETNFTARCDEFVSKWGTPLFHDQDILNELCKGDVKLVDDRWDLLYPIDDLGDGVVVHFNCMGRYFRDACYSGWSPLREIWFRYREQVLNGRANAQVCPWHKRLCFELVAVFYPLHRLIAQLTDPIHPWVSDFIQRTLLFCWLRKRIRWSIPAI